MTTPVWPFPAGGRLVVSVPNAGQQWTGQQVDQVLKTQVDAGQPKRRRRYTSTAKPISVILLMTTAEYATLKTFRYTTCSDCLPFTKTDPETGADATYVFDGPFKEQVMGGGTWQVTVGLERQS